MAELSVTPQPATVETLTLIGEAQLVGVVSGVRRYEFRLPVRPRVMFTSSKPPGLEVRRGGKRCGFSLDHDDANSWAYSANGIVVRVGADAPRPQAEDYTVLWPDAAERQAALDQWDSPNDAAGLVRSLQVGETTRSGLLLPPPATVAWQVDVPEGAVLRFDGGIVPPELLTAAASDGADLVVAVGGQERGRFRLGARFEPFQVDLGPEGNTTARISFTVTDANPALDYVFIAEPRVVVPSARPQRVVLIFIDTLRRDHLGVYGYDRAPTPNIDRWSTSATVFEDARTIAPWTLPSTRTVLTGNHPERWSVSPTLPQTLAARGWATGAFVGNIYLTGAFDMTRGWGEHHARNLPYADYQAERALEFLGRHDDEDAMLMVHFMDLHLPYKEHWPWRSKYVTEEPKGLREGFNRATLLRFAQGKSAQDKVATYLIDRYDQNLAAVDHALGRLLDAVGPDATVVLFADHGEEFFDHGDLEHGHTVYDELLRIPLILSSPGLAHRRVDAPTSLLDITPTVLELLGVEGREHDGFSLAPLARGESDPRFADRPRDFGRVLYGPSAWGSVASGQKWVAREGVETVYDLIADPSEAKPVPNASPLPGRAALSDALAVPVRAVFRLTPSATRGKASSASFFVPGGIESVWLADEPTRHAQATYTISEQQGGDVLAVSFTTTGIAQRELYVLPTLPPEQAVIGARLFAPEGPSQALLSRSPDVGTGPLARLTKSGRAVEVGWAHVPLPFGDELDGFDSESAEALKALGYLQDRGKPDEP